MEQVPALKGTPSSMIEQAIKANANLDQLAKLLDIQERWEKNESLKAYNEAMAKFKENPPDIEKKKSVGFESQGRSVGYKHATLFDVTSLINKELSKWGLSASWRPSVAATQISVTCRITHKLGHFEETTLTAPSDTSGSKNAIQAIGSTITYLERYSLLAMVGLATKDQDDDANSADPIDDKQKNTLLDKIAEHNVNIPKFLKYMKVESLDLIPKSKYIQATTAIEILKPKVTA